MHPALPAHGIPEQDRCKAMELLLEGYLHRNPEAIRGHANSSLTRESASDSASHTLWTQTGFWSSDINPRASHGHLSCHQFHCFSWGVNSVASRLVLPPLKYKAHSCLRHGHRRVPDFTPTGNWRSGPHHSLKLEVQGSQTWQEEKFH